MHAASPAALACMHSRRPLTADAGLLLAAQSRAHTALHCMQMLAVAGRQAAPSGAELWLVQFYSASGEHLRSMRVPGAGGVASLAWEGCGLRLGLAVGPALLFAAILAPRRWTYFGGTLVYAFAKPERQEACVMFWNTSSNERFAKYVRRVSHVAAAGELCLLVARVRARVRAWWQQGAACVARFGMCRRMRACRRIIAAAHARSCCFAAAVPG